MVIGFSWATLDLAAMNLVSYLLLPVRHLMYAQTPKAWLDASEKMQSAGTSIASTEVRDLLKVT